LGDLTMAERYTLKKKNGQRIKIKKGELYNYTLKPGLCVSFQEQVGHVGEPVHTHIWVEPESDELTHMLLAYLLDEFLCFPRRVRLVAFLQAWDLLGEEITKNPLLLELICDGKFSQTMATPILVWVEEVEEIISGYMAMKRLFAEV